MFRKLTSLSAAIFIAGGLSVSAQAADIYADPGYNWTGMYVGGHIGYGFGDKQWGVLSGVGGGGQGGEDRSNAVDYDVDGILGGVQVGYNWQMNSVLFGFEGDFAWTGIDGSGLGGVQSDDRPFSTDVNWLSTVALRGGIVQDRALFFAKLGLGIIDEDHTHDSNNGLVKGGETRAGWLVGAGVEYALTEAWTMKAEYNFIEFNSSTVRLDDVDDEDFGKFSIDQNMHIIKVGVNYRF